ncbi:hypothetical protein B484DRAFT_94071 [Ochromonadaceae sp. CCMP2298]|nr:hypothetical protein B484DRAFT_94071 [Ochromonadaceae sp. CCMP2298]
MMSRQGHRVWCRSASNSSTCSWGESFGPEREAAESAAAAAESAAAAAESAAAAAAEPSSSGSFTDLEDLTYFADFADFADLGVTAGVTAFTDCRDFLDFREPTAKSMSVPSVALEGGGGNSSSVFSRQNATAEGREEV